MQGLAPKMSLRLQLSVLFVVLFTASLLVDLNSAIKIEITPKKFTGQDGQTDVKIACTLDDKEESAKEIVLLKIARKGDRGMVFMYSNSSIIYGNADEDEVTVTGSIETDILKSSLTMVIKEPETEDTGAYICMVKYKLPSGTDMINKANDKLAINDPEVNKINMKVTELLEKVKKEQTELKQIGEKEKKDKNKVGDLEVKAKKQEGEISELLNKEKEVENKVTELEDKTEKQLKKIEELSNKEETEVKSLKSTIKTLVDKMKKDEEQIQEIGTKEAEDKVKVTDLEEKAETQTKELQDLAEKEKKVETKVTGLEQETKDALKKMQDLTKKETTDKSKVTDLEQKAEKQSKELESLADKETEVETRMTELEEKVEKFMKKVNDFKLQSKTKPTVPITKPKPKPPKTGGGGNTNTVTVKDTPISAFSATIQSKFLSVNKGQTLTFPDIVMQAGKKSYNENNGVYTAPIEGLYHFSLTLKVNCISCYIRVDVMAGLRLVFRLKVGVIYDENQNSASSVVLLKRGQTVKAIIDYSSEGAVLSPKRLCLFSGYLIHAS